MSSPIEYAGPFAPDKVTPLQRKRRLKRKRAKAHAGGIPLWIWLGGAAALFLIARRAAS